MRLCQDSKLHTARNALGLQSQAAFGCQNQPGLECAEQAIYHIAAVRAVMVLAHSISPESLCLIRRQEHDLWEGQSSAVPSCNANDITKLLEHTMDWLVCLCAASCSCL